MSKAKHHIDMQNNIPSSVSIMEVGPRDGFQNEKKLISTKEKINIINGLSKSGLKRIEVTAFVSPKWIPQLADQKEVVLGFVKNPDVSYAVLIPNLKGYERALLTQKIDEVSFVVSVSNSHNLKNLNASTNEVLARYHEVSKNAFKDKIKFRAYLSCSFGCPYEGKVDNKKVLDLALELLNMGAYEISISDTIGVANPVMVEDLVSCLIKKISPSNLALHMHDTKGRALANIYAALKMGLSSFDSSFGGLGGCPYAKGASGNVATEDLVDMLDSMGINSGVNVDDISDLSLMMEKIIGRSLLSKISAIKKAKAGFC